MAKQFPKIEPSKPVIETTDEQELPTPLAGESTLEEKFAENWSKTSDKNDEDEYVCIRSFEFIDGNQLCHVAQGVMRCKEKAMELESRRK